jgi:hypothetical protein
MTETRIRGRSGYESSEHATDLSSAPSLAYTPTCGEIWPLLLWTPCRPRFPARSTLSDVHPSKWLDAREHLGQLVDRELHLHPHRLRGGLDIYPVWSVSASISEAMTADSVTPCSLARWSGFSSAHARRRRPLGRMSGSGQFWDDVRRAAIGRQATYANGNCRPIPLKKSL